MKLGCRWENCGAQVNEYRRVILDTRPVAYLGLCTDHTEAFDRAVTRGGVEIEERLNEAVTVRLA